MSLVQTAINVGFTPIFFWAFLKSFVASVVVSFFVIYFTIPIVSKWLNKAFLVNE
jgi:antibiotic biosynthesis monooxygenase (ABM) superfamily enzyme